MMWMVAAVLMLAACQDKKTEAPAQETETEQKKPVETQLRQDDKDVNVDVPTIQVDSVTGLQTYTNKKYRYTVVVPANYVIGEEPVVGDGCEIWSKDSTVILNTFAGYYDEMADQLPLRQALKWAEDWNVDEGVEITRTEVRNDAHYVWGTTQGKKRFTKGMLYLTAERDEILFVRITYKDDRQLEELMQLNHWWE